MFRRCGAKGPIAAVVQGDRPKLYSAGAFEPVAAERLIPVGTGPWAGFVSYEIGHLLEPTSTARRPGLAGTGVHADAAWGMGGWLKLEPASGEAGPEASCKLGELHSAWGRDAYTKAVARVGELIHAGDAYQANLTHALVGTVAGSTRALFADLAQAASPAFGCYLELPALADGRRRAVLGLSPELLVRYDATTRQLTTEPMKGTRPATDSGLHDLRVAEKDKAELAMIVDLMRNDLGRVSEVGSVSVQEPRIIQRHGPDTAGVWQASGRVVGTLRDGLTLHDALCALLPAGSITGAPKVRAMQMIHELEPHPRGPYCGALGMIDAEGNAELAVGIRTAVVVGDELRYSVGAGIVADSDPQAEWAETLSKAGPLRAIGARIWDDR